MAEEPPISASPASPQVAPPSPPDAESIRRDGGEGADLRGWQGAGENLAGVRLGGAVLVGAVLTRANLRGADLRGADLTGADLRRADLREAQLQGARLDQTRLEKARLEGARLNQAQLSGCLASEAVADGADFRSATMQGGRWDRVSLRGAILAEATFQDVHMEEAVVEHASADSSQWTGCSLVATDAPGMDLRNARFRSCNLQEIDLTGGDLRDTRFEGVDLASALLDGVRLKGLDLQGCTLKRASFREVVGLEPAQEALLRDGGAWLAGGFRARLREQLASLGSTWLLAGSALVVVVGVALWLGLRPTSSTVQALDGQAAAPLPQDVGGPAQAQAQSQSAGGGYLFGLVSPTSKDQLALGIALHPVPSGSLASRGTAALANVRLTARDPSGDSRNAASGYDITAVGARNDGTAIYVRYLFQGSMPEPRDLRFWVEQGKVMSTIEVKMDNPRLVVQITPVAAGQPQPLQVPDAFVRYERVIDVTVPLSSLGPRFRTQARMWVSGFQVCCQDFDTRQVPLDRLDEAIEVTATAAGTKPAASPPASPPAAPSPAGDGVNSQGSAPPGVKSGTSSLPPAAAGR